MMPERQKPCKPCPKSFSLTQVGEGREGGGAPSCRLFFISCLMTQMHWDAQCMRSAFKEITNIASLNERNNSTARLFQPMWRTKENRLVWWDYQKHCSASGILISTVLCHIKYKIAERVEEKNRLSFCSLGMVCFLPTRCFNVFCMVSMATVQGAGCSATCETILAQQLEKHKSLSL